MSVFHWSVLGLVALVASTLAGVTGFGGAAVLLPALAAAFGVRQAIPILTVAQLVGNGSRVWFNRRELDLQVVKWFSLGAAPLALAGRSEEHTSELQSRQYLVCRLLLENKN